MITSELTTEKVQETSQQSPVLATIVFSKCAAASSLCIWLGHCPNQRDTISILQCNLPALIEATINIWTSEARKSAPLRAQSGKTCLPVTPDDDGSCSQSVTVILGPSTSRAKRNWPMPTQCLCRFFRSKPTAAARGGERGDLGALAPQYE